MYNEFEEFGKTNNMYLYITGNLTTKVHDICYYIDGRLLLR